MAGFFEDFQEEAGGSFGRNVAKSIAGLFGMGGLVPDGGGPQPLQPGPKTILPQSPLQAPLPGGDQQVSAIPGPGGGAPPGMDRFRGPQMQQALQRALARLAQ